MGSEMCIRDSIEVFQTNNFSKKVIFFPGWLGHKDSKYLIPLADLLYSRGFDIVRIHPIDHGDSEHLNEDFFRATDIRALIEVVKYLGQKFSDNEIHLIGFSLGGNISLRISASPEINFLKKTIVLSPVCLLYTSPSPRDLSTSRMPSSA